MAFFRLFVVIIRVLIQKLQELFGSADDNGTEA